jgi:hypothetical protein
MSIASGGEFLDHALAVVHRACDARTLTPCEALGCDLFTIETARWGALRAIHDRAQTQAGSPGLNHRPLTGSRLTDVSLPTAYAG